MAFQGLAFGICGSDQGNWQKIEETVVKLGGRFLLEGRGFHCPIDYIVSTDGRVDTPTRTLSGRYVPKEGDVKYVRASWVLMCCNAGGMCFKMAQP